MNRLGSREKLALGALAAVVCLIMIHAFVISPGIERRRQAEKEVSSQKKNLADIAGLAERYRELKASSNTMSLEFRNREKNFALFKFLDGLAGKANVKKNIKYMKPNSKNLTGGRFVESIVDMKLQNLSMEQLLGYLYQIETSGNSVTVRRITITESGRQGGSVDAVLLVAAYEESKG